MYLHLQALQSTLQRQQLHLQVSALPLRAGAEEEATDMRTTLTPEELEYLTGERRLGRLATVQPDGFPHAVPVGWRYVADLGRFDFFCLDAAATKKFRNVAANPKVAFVVDD